MDTTLFYFNGVPVAAKSDFWAAPIVPASYLAWAAWRVPRPALDG